MILIGAGEIGGARAISPALGYFQKWGCPFAVIDHGVIGLELPASYNRTVLPDSDPEIRKSLMGGVRAYMFGTSLHDPYPLRVARRARECNIPVICVLDNWMNYRWRLEMDGKPFFIPDIYAVMDQLAEKEALQEGIPQSIIRVIGHPGLSDLIDLYTTFVSDEKREEVMRKSSLALDERKLLVFVSEPVEMDQGGDPASSKFRGYTEKTVLRLLLDNLQAFSNSVVVGLVPHPRENPEGLLRVWEESKGSLQGGVLRAENGREAIFIADGVCGMSSLLLYAAFLLGKPLLSLQPDLRLPHLLFLKNKGARFFVTERDSVGRDVVLWLEHIDQSRGKIEFHEEIFFHQGAPQRLAELVRSFTGRSSDKRRESF
jgi:hypothetical protein